MSYASVSSFVVSINLLQQPLTPEKVKDDHIEEEFVEKAVCGFRNCCCCFLVAVVVIVAVVFVVVVAAAVFFFFVIVVDVFSLLLTLMILWLYFCRY